MNGLLKVWMSFDTLSGKYCMYENNTLRLTSLHSNRVMFEDLPKFLTLITTKSHSFFEATIETRILGSQMGHLLLIELKMRSN